MTATGARTRTYFISDVHLGASYIKDARAHENRVVSFLRSIEGDAKALYLLGDILDYWFEYRTVVPRGYVRFFGQLARMADAGVRLVWFTGNHDIWLFDYLRDEIGVEIVNVDGSGIPEDIDGTMFYLGHGDMFGRQPLSYRMLRSVFHNKLCQKLYSGLHPRWTIPFAHGWSSQSRKGQSAPEPRMSEKTLQAVTDEAARLVEEYPRLRYIVIGHHHVALDRKVSDNCCLIVLGNWISDSTYAVFDGSQLELREWNGEN